MNPAALRALLQEVARGACSPEEALETLRKLPFVEGAETLADTHRAIRVGLPEVVFARHKTPGQVAEALGSLHQAHGHALATHVSDEMAVQLKTTVPAGSHDPVSGLFAIGRMEPASAPGHVAVVC